MMPLEAFTFRLSISYLIFDSFFGIYKGYNDFFMLVHHGIMLSVFLYALYMYTRSPAQFSPYLVTNLATT